MRYASIEAFTAFLLSLPREVVLLRLNPRSMQSSQAGYEVIFPAFLRLPMVDEA